MQKAAKAAFESATNAAVYGAAQAAALAAQATADNIRAVTYALRVAESADKSNAGAAGWEVGKAIAVAESAGIPPGNFVAPNYLSHQVLWHTIDADCKWLAQHIDPGGAARIITRRSLWFGPLPQPWKQHWDQLRDLLLEIDQNYTVWVSWYERRIRGENAAFDIPGDTGRKEDKAILRRLAEATDEDFWSKGYKHVNAELTRWLEEARARAALNLEPPVAPLAGEGLPPPLVPQNTLVISFRTDEASRIAIDQAAFPDRLRSDPDARDRHAEVLRETLAWRDKCRTSNTAARLTGFLDDYVEALGAEPANARPASVVLRGERLRQELAAYDAVDPSLPPIPDALRLDGKGWQSAHNLMVAFDPLLRAADTAMLDPERPPLLIPPDEIVEFVDAAEEEGLLAEGTRPVVAEAAVQAPAVPDPLDRRTVRSTEIVRNLVVELFELASRHPSKWAVAGMGVAVAANAGVLVATAGTVGGIAAAAWGAASFVLKRRQWIEERLGRDTTTYHAFVDTMDWLERNFPFKEDGNRPRNSKPRGKR